MTIRPMKRADVEVMAQWRPSVDPLYQPFDFPQRSKAEHIRWFEWRSKDPSRRLYTIEDEKGRIIGSLTLREIDGRRSARLGITLGADYVSQGYGTEALRLFLDYYFGALGFGQMVLDVAAINLRAVRSYQALGFRRVAQHYCPADHESYRSIQRDPRYQHLRIYFRQQAGITQVLFYDMILTSEEWEALSQQNQQVTTQPLGLDCPIQATDGSIGVDGIPQAAGSTQPLGLDCQIQATDGSNGVDGIPQAAGSDDPAGSAG